MEFHIHIEVEVIWGTEKSVRLTRQIANEISGGIPTKNVREIFEAIACEFTEEFVHGFVWGIVNGIFKGIH